MEVQSDTEIADACRYKYNISVFYDFYERRDGIDLYVPKPGLK